jgi:hypothetical protein
VFFHSETSEEKRKKKKENPQIDSRDSTIRPWSLIKSRTATIDAMQPEEEFEEGHEYEPVWLRSGSNRFVIVVLLNLLLLAVWAWRR